MEQDAVFEEKVALSPKDMNMEVASFDDLLMKKMRKQIEGKCTKHGFLIPNSLKLLSRSYGYMEKGTFTADCMYYIKAQGRVYNPPNGTVVEGVVIRKSKAGLYIVIENAVHVMVVRDLHIGNKEFDSVEMGDTIRVEIKKSRFQINDPHILSIGQFLTRTKEVSASVASASVASASATSVAPVVPATLEEEEEEDDEAEEEDDATLEDEEDDAKLEGDATLEGAVEEADPFKAANPVEEEISL